MKILVWLSVSMSVEYSGHVLGFLRMPSPPSLRKLIEHGECTPTSAAPLVTPLVHWWTLQNYDLHAATSKSYDVGVVIVHEDVTLNPIVSDLALTNHTVKLQLFDMFMYEKNRMVRIDDTGGAIVVYFTLTKREL